MGKCFTFKCPKCQYSAMVSGGEDCGEVIWTQTILCLDCLEVMDAVAAVRRGSGGEAEYAADLIGEVDEEASAVLVRIRCNKDRNHRWRAWNEPDTCPKCGTLMVRNPSGPVTLWD